MNKRRHKGKAAEESGSGTGARSGPKSRGKSTAVFGPSELAVPEPFCRALQKYPSLRRHPHPLVVHFPIVFFLAAAFFTLVYLVTDSTFETTAFHCLGAGVLSVPPAMLTGELTRRVNYPQEPIRAFRVEIYYSGLLLALSGGAFLWRWLDPTILINFRWLSVLYLLLILSLPVLVTIISYFGGLLTFPLEKEEN